MKGEAPRVSPGSPRPFPQHPESRIAMSVASSLDAHHEARTRRAGPDAHHKPQRLPRGPRLARLDALRGQEVTVRPRVDVPDQEAHHRPQRSSQGPCRRVCPGGWPRVPALSTSPSAHHVRHVARMSQEPAERTGTGRDETGRGGITTPNHSGRLRGKGAILLEVSHRPERVRFPLPPSREAQQSHQVAGFFFALVFFM